jgi:uncharacterized protein (TIGR00730 family)
MPVSLPQKRKVKTEQRKLSVSVSDTGLKHYVHWLCSPGNKCVPVQEESFTDNINWRIFRIMAEFIEGFEFLSKLKGEVTVFGSARALPGSEYYKVAKDIGAVLGKNGYTVITGGGPGMMEAANWGAFESGAESVGLDIQLPMEQRRNQFVKKGMGFHYFFTRKVMLSASAQAYVIMPGGFGTLDEMTEMITLIQTGKIPPNVPIIMVGKKFWQPFVDWVTNIMCDQQHFIDREEIKIMHVVDSAEEVLQIIQTTSEREFG